MAAFLHFWLDAVYFIEHNVNDIGLVLQVFRHSNVKLRTFHAFLHDTPGLLRLGAGVELGAGLKPAGSCDLNRAKLGTLPPRLLLWAAVRCCGVLFAGVLWCLAGLRGGGQACVVVGRLGR